MFDTISITVETISIALATIINQLTLKINIKKVQKAEKGLLICMVQQHFAIQLLTHFRLHSEGYLVCLPIITNLIIKKTKIPTFA